MKTMIAERDDWRSISAPVVSRPNRIIYNNAIPFAVLERPVRGFDPVSCA
jgi:hypothetical protein